MTQSTVPTQERYDPATYRTRTPKGGGTSWIFSSNVPHRAPLICYICGIETPIVSASVSGGVWTIPQCRVGLFPDPRLQRLGAEDRLPIVIFFLDEYLEPEKPTWRMLFEGEVVGWSYMNSAVGRTVGLDCVMDIAAWTQLFLYYMSTVQGLADGLVQQGQDGATITQAVTALPYGLFHRGLMPEAKAGEKASPEEFITRPYDFPYNVIRNLISTMKPDKLRCMPAVNFFTRWCRRQNFQNKWVALPFLDSVYDTSPLVPVLRKDQLPGIFPLFRAVKADFAIKAMQNQVVEELSGASIYQMLKRVLDIVFMELTMLATPPYVKTDLDGEIVGPGPILLGEPLRGASAGQAANAAAQGTPYNPNPRTPGRLGNYFVKPICVFGLPPVCNVIFPSMTPQISYNESYITQPTRLYIEDPALASIVTGEENPQRLLINVLARGYPPQADRRYQDRVRSIYSTGKNVLIYPEEFFKGPVTSVAQAPSWFMYFQQLLNAQPQGPTADGGNIGGSNFTATPDKDKSPVETGQTSLTEGDLYKLYAQYEYFRQRYEKRQGAVVCAFDPYIVPGFPMIAFDETVTSQFHLIGYLMNYSHDITAESVQTSINFSYGRTIYEWLTDIANEIDHPQNGNTAGLATASAPPEPLPEVRDVLQHEWHADQFYAQLFNRATQENLKGNRAKSAVCRIRDLLSIVKPDGTLEPLRIEGKNAALLRIEREKTTYSTQVLADIRKLGNPGGNSLEAPIVQGYFLGSLPAEWAGKLEDALQFVANQAAYVASAYPSVSGVTANFTYKAPKDPSFLTLGDVAAYLDDANTVIRELERALQNPITKHNLSNISSQELVPSPAAVPFFDSYDDAMKFVARPICTLEEYISFIGGVREGAIDDVAYKDQGDSTVPSARYYARIRYLKGATAADDAKVTDAQQGFAPAAKPTDPNAPGPDKSQSIPDVVGEAVPTDFPVLRAPWDQILLSYRAAIHSSTPVSR